MPHLKEIFGQEQLEEWMQQAVDLNTKGMGDTGCFYLRRP
jgi:hypothetical protein